MENLKTEDEVRTKVVYEWLRCNGIQPNEIKIERSVHLKLGHGQYELSKLGRYDLLVKSLSGANLILFEVKASTETINEEVVDQAVSYARLLKGNMAPIVVVTNGDKCNVHCSLTKKIIGIIDISKTMSGQFHYVSDEHHQVELEALSTLSRSCALVNYICKEISKVDIGRLSGELGFFKKHCDRLYFPIGGEYLSESDVLLIYGPPQSGKTNYICNAYYETISKGGRALFFMATTIRKGILSHLKEQVSFQLDTLSRTKAIEEITSDIFSGGGLVIFIDGLNEVPIRERIDIISDLEKVAQSKVRVVISCTDSFVRTIKVDCFNNHIELFKTKEGRTYSEIKISRLDNDNYNDVIAHYQSVYNTSDKPIQKLTSINAVGKFYELIHLGHSSHYLDSEYKILIKILDEKCSVISDIESNCCQEALLWLAKEMANSLSRIRETSFSKELTGRSFATLPDTFKVNGLLDVSDGFIEFYDETYRDILLIRDVEGNNNPDDVINILASFKNKDISYTCLFKYLCFHKVSATKIFELDLNIQVRMIDTIMSYIEACELASTHSIGLILDLALNGIKNSLMKKEKAESVLIFIADICSKQSDIHVDHVKTQYILGYCSCSIDLSYVYEFYEHPVGFYNGEHSSVSIYNFIGGLFNDYLIEDRKFVFDGSYVDEIEFSRRLYGDESVKIMEGFYYHLIDHVLNYDSFMCSYGSYLSVEINEFRDSGASGGLICIRELLLDLKTKLSNSVVFDELIYEINHELRENFIEK